MAIFRRVLLALDGSQLSEQGFKLVKAVSGSLDGAEFSLLRVVTPVDGRDHAEQLEEAREYLSARQGSCPGGEAQLLVRSAEDPAAEILQVAEEGHDLVVTMTHGRGGLKRWVWGSVAERVIRHCGVPLLLGSARAASLPEKIQRILVPLDGSEHAASVLTVVRNLAQAVDAEVVLVRAFWVDVLENAASYGKVAEDLRIAIEADVAKHVRALEQDGVRVSSVVALSDAASLILKAAGETGSDMIAMTTHGRTGVKRWLLGSVAEKVLRASILPVLLVRVPTEKLS